MKNVILCFLAAFVLLLVVPTQVKAGHDKRNATLTSASTESNAMADRLNELKATDKSSLNSAERKDLRKEVRAIKSELKVKGESTYIEGSNGGLYISAGAAIIIVLLLVLLL